MRQINPTLLFSLEILSGIKLTIYKDLCDPYSSCPCGISFANLLTEIDYYQLIHGDAK